MRWVDINRYVLTSTLSEKRLLILAEVSRLGEQCAFAIHQTRRKVAGESLEFFRKIQRNSRLPGLNLPATSHLRSQIVDLSGSQPVLNAPKPTREPFIPIFHSG